MARIFRKTDLPTIDFPHNYQFLKSSSGEGSNVIACGNTITGVLDWAELRLGDPIYDIAYLEFWSPHIRYQQLWQHWANDRSLSVARFAERMQCYMTHIGLSGLAIAAMRDDLEDYDRIRARMQTAITAG
jgi:hygromycin-B 4-O-kinase